MSNTITPTVFYRTLNVEGLEIFYREAGPRNAPTVLLLHGFPSSSHMFRNLIPMLADKYHVVVPDFPGVDRIGSLMHEFLDRTINKK
jgi:pimeloyl-ACP methyl ester carboxylesterase